MEELLGELGGQIGSVFEDIEFAEEVIKEEIKKGLPKERADERFVFLQRPQGMKNKEVYRAHIIELLRREGMPLSEATLAEICTGFSESSLQAPLGMRGLFLYGYCFNRMARLSGDKRLMELAEDCRKAQGIILEGEPVKEIEERALPEVRRKLRSPIRERREKEGRKSGQGVLNY